MEGTSEGAKATPSGWLHACEVYSAAQAAGEPSWRPLQLRSPRTEGGGDPAESPQLGVKVKATRTKIEKRVAAAAAAAWVEREYGAGAGPAGASARTETAC